MLRFAIIGAGLIGKKRADAISGLGHQIKVVCDVRAEAAKSLAEKFQADIHTDLSFLAKNEVDAAIVATSNDALAPTVCEALRHGKHVLVEKPGGRNPNEVAEWCRLSEAGRAICRVGFNHRFHPTLLKAKSLLENEAIGPLMFFRAKYGHGGRIGYDKEWRAQPEKGGGGELIDQGVHLIDLCRWLGGEFTLEHGVATTYFWNMPVDDNGFLLLKSPHSELRAWLHASCTEWKNTFEFEIFGKRGKIQITGLGRSYGPEELKLYKVKPEMGVPLQETYTFPEEDRSWALETQSFIDAIEGRPSPIAQPQDALRAVELVYDTYRSSGMSWI